MFQNITANQTLNVLALQRRFGYDNRINVDIVRKDNLNIKLMTANICGRWGGNQSRSYRVYIKLCCQSLTYYCSGCTGINHG